MRKRSETPTRRPGKGATARATLCLLSLGALSVLLACGSSEDTPLGPPCQTLDLSRVGPGDFFGQVEVGGICREFLLHIPPPYPADELVPLVLGLHPYSTTSVDMMLRSNLSSTADRSGFVAVYPQALGDPPRWNAEPVAVSSDDVGFMRALIAELTSGLALDRHRVYVTGFSNGGSMANRVACDLSDVVAGVAPVSGSYRSYQDCEPRRAMPVISIHGAMDTVVPTSGDPASGTPPTLDWARWWAAANGCAPEPEQSLLSSSVASLTWDDCRDGVKVRLIAIDHWGHTWPLGPTGAPIDGADTVWAFLSEYRLPD